MKNRNKKYNPAKSARIFSSKGLNNLGVFYDYRSIEKYPFKLVNTQSLNDIKLTDINSFTLKEVKHKWTVILISTGLDANGEQSFSYGFASSGDYQYQRDLVDSLKEQHKKFAYDNSEIVEIQNHCWLAIPNISACNDIDDAVIFNLLNKYEAW
ncbi:hypothetical protein PP586_gp21 [Pseudoalteromonas phage vB_PspS-H40/1]|uniref:hypothetical protein n=1 Tax=Pseudoalteromonas phage vB_PspS-H40/1 TaxID=1856120 RepID=UPI0007DCC66D|nr:hypothetical protein PP586_gp21 [Pseudoalteromonas phage vB_PspS-H40/1]ANI22038.1 hypothetical protein H401_21 [Pseudoalteromonas phage vB_PspS-H40/1]